MTKTAHWDRLAPLYDEASAWLERRLLARGRRWVCARARGRVLEVGVGTGANLELYDPSVGLTAIDASEGMLAQARAKVAAVPVTARPREVELVHADAGALPFADHAFDAVLSTYVLCCVPDVDAALAEAVRVLRPGGDLLLADHVASTAWPVRMGQRLIEGVTGATSDEHLTRRPLDHLAAHGLTLVEAQRHSAGVMEALHARRPG